MLRHCTVIAVKTNIGRSAAPLEQSEGETNQKRTGKDMSTPGRMGVQMGYPGKDKLNIEVLCKFHHSLFDFKHRDDISRKILFFFLFPQVFKLTEEVIIRSGVDGIWFLFGESFYLSDHFPPDFNLFASQEPALFCV